MGGNALITAPTNVTLQPPYSANSKLPNLHHFWDEALGKTNKFDDIARLGQDLMRELPRTQLAGELQTVGYDRWAEEGRAIATGWVYSYDGQAVPCLAKTEVEHRLKSNEVVAVPVLPAGYVDLARQIARHRVALAGYRLADELQAALGR